MEVERKRLDLLVCRNDCTRMVVKGIQCAWYPEFVLKVVLHHRKRFTRSFDLGGPDSPSRQGDRLLWKQKHRHTHTHTHTPTMVQNKQTANNGVERFRKEGRKEEKKSKRKLKTCVCIWTERGV